MKPFRRGIYLILVLSISACSPEFEVLEDSLSGRTALHGKYFGTSVVHDALFNTSQAELSQRYNEVIKSQFNLLVPESEMKMASIWTSETTINYAKLDAIADYAVQNNLKMRGHVLLWYRSVPVWLVEGYRNGTWTRDQIAVMVQNYIHDIMGHFKALYPGLVIAWDVVNEAIGPNDPRTVGKFGLRPAGMDWNNANEDFWRLTLGDSYVERAFSWAHEADPEARLFYNDYHGEYPNPKGEAILSFVKDLKIRGIPIHGMGLQCHFAVSWLDMTWAGIKFSFGAISDSVDEWLATGLEIQITEADIGMLPGQEQRQAEFYAALLGATLLKEGVTAFVTWGFTDLVSWRQEDKALYFDMRINPKASYESMLTVLANWQ